LDVGAFFQIGERINYAPPPMEAPFLGNTHDAFVRVALRPNARLTFEQTYIFTQLDAKDAVDTAAGRVFANHLTRSKFSLQLTRALSLRVIGDYAAVDATPALTSIGSNRRVTGDVLATYQLNPFTALYIGYTSNFEPAEDSQPAGLRQIADWPAITRQFFAKVSYGIRF
jgi:hypothetical protein